MEKSKAVEVLSAAKSAAYTPARASGCGRAYVCLCGDKAEVKSLAAACKALGLVFLKKAYGTSGNAIYLGYDNCDGRALGRAAAFAESLNQNGVKAYADAVGD